MGLDSSESGGKELRKTRRNKIMIKLSNRERRFIIVSDFLIVGFIILDLLFIADLINMNLTSLTLANLIMVGFSYYYMRYKRRITIRAIREAEKNGGNTRSQ